MSPRRYSMIKKSAQASETRQRIVEATLKLHGQNGIFGTSWKAIAAEADVSIGTVYKYFPSLDELVPACGELLMERVQPPYPESITEILGNASAPTERLHRVAGALFAFYERGGRHLDADRRERELPAIHEWEDFLRTLVAGFVETALATFGPDRSTIAHLAVLFDLPTFRAMQVRGITTADAAQTAADMAVAWLKHRSMTERTTEDLIGD